MLQAREQEDWFDPEGFVLAFERRGRASRRLLLDQGAPRAAAARARRARRDLRDRRRPEPPRPRARPCPHHRRARVARRTRHHRRHALRRRRQRGRGRPVPRARVRHPPHRPRVRARRRGDTHDASRALRHRRAPSSTRSSPSGASRATAPSRCGTRSTASRSRSTTPPRSPVRSANGSPTRCPSRSTQLVEQTAHDDMTSKWLWSCARDGAQIETVLMRYPERATVCVSSQAGCAMGCTFCATGQAGFERHLDVGEIVEQVLRAAQASPQRVSNVVFMGMGEPLANYDTTWAAVHRLHDDLGLSARRITISTVGVVPGDAPARPGGPPGDAGGVAARADRRRAQRARAAQPPLPDRRGARRRRRVRRRQGPPGDVRVRRASPARTTPPPRPRRSAGCSARSPAWAAPT